MKKLMYILFALRILNGRNEKNAQDQRDGSQQPKKAERKEE